MEKIEFRKLNANEIDCRVATVKQPQVSADGKMSGGGCSILLYKDARVDMRLLDEMFGALGWKREHQTIDVRLYCTISVYDERIGQWVSKQDVGTESYTEKEKGQASDSFKRAGFNWGIGRELYTAPFIWIVPKEKEWRRTNNGFQLNVNLRVESIEYENDEIIFLRLVDNEGNVRYSWGTSPRKAKDMEMVQNAENIEALKSIYKDSMYRDDKEFIAAVNKRKAELQAA